jgi:hypothetical protein
MLGASSKVESQESCIHLMLSHTTRARPVLRCSPLLSRHKNGRKMATAAPMCSLSQTVYTSKPPYDLLVNRCGGMLVCGQFSVGIFVASSTTNTGTFSLRLSILSPN